MYGFACRCAARQAQPSQHTHSEPRGLGTPPLREAERSEAEGLASGFSAVDKLPRFGERLLTERPARRFQRAGVSPGPPPEGRGVRKILRPQCGRGSDGLHRLYSPLPDCRKRRSAINYEKSDVPNCFAFSARVISHLYFQSSGVIRGYFPE